MLDQFAVSCGFVDELVTIPNLTGIWVDEFLRFTQV
jgi:hypothetical protein